MIYGTLIDTQLSNFTRCTSAPALAKMKSALLISLFGLTAVLAAPRSDYSIHSSHYVPSGWTKGNKANADQLLRLRIGLKQASFAALEKDLLEISDPNHARYGKHLSSSEIHAHTAPSDEALDAVREWLEGFGVGKGELEYSGSKVSFDGAGEFRAVEYVPTTCGSPLSDKQLWEDRGCCAF